MSKIQTIGIHKVTNASLDAPIVEQALAGEVVSILYTDPPWNNAAYWKTLTKKMTGQEVRQISSSDILANIFRLAKKYVHGHVFVEYGPRWREQVNQLFRENLHNVRVFDRTYLSGGRALPSILVYGATSKDYYFNDEKAAHSDSLTEIIAPVARPGAVIFDPCCGKGNTARAAMKLGMRFIGNELNAERLKATINSLKAG
jgi:hypothetical protein